MSFLFSQLKESPKFSFHINILIFHSTKLLCQKSNRKKNEILPFHLELLVGDLKLHDMIENSKVTRVKNVRMKLFCH